MFNKPHIDNILFATDLSENANRALGYAVSLAHAYAARVTILHVVEKLPPNAELLLVSYLGYRDLDELRQKNEAEIIRRIEGRIKWFCAETIQQVPECRFMLHEVIAEPGKAAERILHHVGTGVYDILVIGTRGHGVVQDALMGGTSRRVVRESPIPVFTIPVVSG